MVAFPRVSIGIEMIRNSLVCLCLIWFVSPSSARAAEATHVLTLADGSVCYGSLLPNSNEQQIVFQIEGLVDPLIFPQNAVRSLRKVTLQADEAPAKEKMDSNWLVRLSDQQAIVGEIESLDQSGITIASRSIGTIKISRDQLVRIEQDSAAREPIKTVMQKAEWKDPNDMNAWKIDPSRVSTAKQGARLISDFAVPGRCEIRMNLRWSKKPNFAIGFGVDKNTMGPDKAQWGVPQGVKIATTGRNYSFASIETWGDDLLFVRESTAQASIEQLGTTKGSSCVLTIYLDIKAGVAAVRMNNSALKQLQVDSKVVAGKLQAMQFQNFSGDIAIENLEILKWNGQLPLDYFGQPSFVQMSSGEKMDGFVDRYDPEAKSFVVKAGDVEKVVRTADVMSGALATVTITDAANANPAEGQNAEPSTAENVATDKAAMLGTATVTLNDGGVLVGKFLPAQDGQLRLSSVLSTEPLRIPLTSVQEISSNDSSSDLADEAEVLIAKCGLSEFKGKLIQDSAVETKTALIWQQLLSINASELDYQVAGELAPIKQASVSVSPSQKAAEANRPRPADANAIFQIFGLGGEPAGNARPNAKTGNDDKATSETLSGSLIRFRSGDSTPAKVLQINEKGVRFESDRTTTTFAPNSTIDQIVFRAAKNNALPEDQRKRLLTIPRAQQNDPPTHLLISTAGDFLRGHLMEVNGERVSIEVRGELLEIPVAELSEVIWLYERDWKTPKEKGEENAAAKLDAGGQVKNEVYIVYAGKQGIALRPTKVSKGMIGGVSELLGESQVPLSEMTVLFWGPNTGLKARELRNQSYRLTLAQMPREAPEDGDSGSSQSAAHPLVGKPAPNFKLKNLAGEAVELEKLRGKVIVLDFWATWCGPCMQTMPLLDQMMTEFDAAKVQLFAVNIQEAKNRIDLALGRLKIEPEVLLDAEGEVGTAYQANAIPQTVIIDAEGNVVKVFVGGGAGVVNQIRNALVDHLETTKN